MRCIRDAILLARHGTTTLVSGVRLWCREYDSRVRSEILWGRGGRLLLRSLFWKLFVWERWAVEERWLRHADKKRRRIRSLCSSSAAVYASYVEMHTRTHVYTRTHRHAETQVAWIGDDADESTCAVRMLRANSAFPSRLPGPAAAARGDSAHPPWIVHISELS